MIKLLSLFSGIGAFEQALTKLNIEHEVVNFSEIYKPSIRSYCKIHNESEDKNLGDITKVNPKIIEPFDLMSYGFPCQSYSIAGKREGMSCKKNGNLFFESMKIVKEKKPKYLIAENVLGLKTIDNGNTFNYILSILNKLGYKNYDKVLNSKYFGVPQDRNRVFIVSVRKDLKQDFHFPIMKKTTKQVKDIVDFSIKDRIIDKDLIPYLDKKFYIFSYNNKQKKVFDGCESGEFNNGWISHRLHSIHGLSPTLTTSNGAPYFYEIRGALIGKERLKLQGFTDKEYVKISKIVTDSEIAYMAGNSITVPILEGIFKNLFDEKYKNSRKDVLNYWL